MFTENREFLLVYDRCLMEVNNICRLYIFTVEKYTLYLEL